MLQFFIFMCHSRAFWRLNGCWIIFTWHILEPNTDIYSTICPWNQFKLILQTRLMQFGKKNTHLLLALRSSILKLYYLCDCGSSISKIQHWSSPLNSLLNSIGLTWFGFSKTKLCPISHNYLIMDWFSRANLYDLPRVTVLSFVSEIDSEETTGCVLVTTFDGTPIQSSERELLKFSHDHLFEMKFRSLKKHYLPQIISPKILRTKFWNFLTNFLKISALHHMNFRFWTFVKTNL